MIDWTEKYRPITFDDLILEPFMIKKGRKSIPVNPKIKIQHWAKSWDLGKPEKKAIILSGKPGIGKTSCAYVIANQFHWTSIEMNTSDARNKTQIKKVATAGSVNETFSQDGSYNTTTKKGRKLIILDEADNLYERDSSGSPNGMNLSDKGGKKEIVSMVQSTKQPIILIVNDYYQLIKGSGKILERLCEHIIFPQPSSTQILILLKRICKNENIDVDASILKTISTQSYGDIRSAVRDLQSLCIGRTHIPMDATKGIGHRDQFQEIFSVLSSIFHGTDIDEIKHNMWNLDVDPQMLLFWVSENIPLFYKHPMDMAKAFHHASIADIYLSRTFRRNNYRMWAYALNHMSIGVSLSKSHPISHHRFSYPTWLRTRKYSESKKQMNIMVNQLSSLYHCSKNKVKAHLIPYINKIESIEIQSHDKIDVSEQTSVKEKTVINNKNEENKTSSKTQDHQKTLFS